MFQPIQRYRLDWHLNRLQCTGNHLGSAARFLRWEFLPQNIRRVPLLAKKQRIYVCSAHRELLKAGRKTRYLLLSSTTSTEVSVCQYCRQTDGFAISYYHGKKLFWKPSTCLCIVCMHKTVHRIRCTVLCTQILLFRIVKNCACVETRTNGMVISELL